MVLDDASWRVVAFEGLHNKGRDETRSPAKWITYYGKHRVALPTVTIFSSLIFSACVGAAR